MQSKTPLSDPDRTGLDLRAQNLSFAYKAKHDVLCGVSLTLSGKNFYALVGPNGAGKTTLLHLLTGYLSPSSGHVSLNGISVTAMSRKHVAANVALVPQTLSSMFAFRVIEIVLMARHPFTGLRVFDTDDDIAIAASALQTCGLEGYENRRMSELSGGEQRLVLIARAVAQQTPILLLDEPLAALDLRHQWQIMNLLSKLRGEGKTILGTFHDLNTAARWCDHLFLLHNGRIAAEGTPAETLTPKLLEELYAIPLSVGCDNFGHPRIDFPQTN